MLPADTKARSLKDIFADTDTISFGPFKIIKKAGEPYTHARFTVYETPVRLTAVQMQVMALLISQKGDDVTTSMLARGVDTELFNHYARTQHQNSTPYTLQLANKELFNNFKVHVSNIRTAIRGALKDAPEKLASLTQCFRSLKEYRKGQERGPETPEKESGYRLQMPTIW